MIHFRLLGRLELQDSDGREIETLLTQPKRLALLAYLLTANRGLRSRDSVIGIFWPEADQAHARGALRQALWFLRRELGDDTIVSRGEDIGVRPGAVSCDVIAFQELIGASRWTQALDLYRGDLLDGFYIADATPEVERWLDAERSRLRSLAQQAARALVKDEGRIGDSVGAVRAARRWLGIAPHDEEALRTLVALLDRSGDRAGAIELFEEFAQHLREEYEVMPSPETLALVEAVRGRSRVVSRLEGSVMSTNADDMAPPSRIAVTSAPLEASAQKRRPRLRTPLAIAAATVFTLGAITAWVSTKRSGGINSLAVLQPPSSASLDQVTASDITEDLISRLSKVSSLTVLAYSTVQHYANSGLPALSVGNKLAVGAVLSWQGRRDGDVVRIDVELVRTRNGALLWRNTYARPADGLSGVENAIAIDVARRLRVPVTAEERQRLSRVGTHDSEAQRLYQQGRHAWSQRSERSVREAIEYFQQAIGRDPGYAEAYAGIADCFIVLGRQQWLPPDVAFPSARVAAQQALALDSTLAEAHASLAVVLNRYDWDRSGSLREFERAIQASPSYATAWHWYSITLETMARWDEALAAARRAVELDPLSPMIRASYSDRNFHGGRYDEALRQIGYVLEVSPNFAPGHLRLGLILLQRHRASEAVAHFQKTLLLTDSTVGLDKLAYAYAILGRTAEARAIAERLDALATSKWVSPVARAEVHLALGDTARAFRLLDEGMHRKDDELVLLHINPRLERLRSSPRFRLLLEQLRLPSNVPVLSGSPPDSARVRS